jgi:hypothetical protein
MADTPPLGRQDENMSGSLIERSVPRVKIPKAKIEGVIESTRDLDFLDLLPASFDLDGRPFNVKERRPMFAPLFRKVPTSRRMIFMSSRQVGKALDLETSIPTPDGWTTMGDLKVGDLVFDDKGAPTTVLAATEPMIGRPCFRISFDDGEEVVADEEHLWVISRVGGLPRTVTTLELLAMLGGAKAGSRPFITTYDDPESSRHYIKSIVPVESRPVKCIGVDSPNRMFLCGRSMIPTHNTASIGGHASMNCLWRRDFRYTYVAPLALYVSRFHHIYMAKMLRSSRLPWDIYDKHCTNAVTEKTFTTGSHFHGVSCFNSAGNALGIPGDCTVFDEVQDLNFDFIPQILEIMGTSDYRYELYFGTARGKENTIQRVFDTSSQAEFCIRCSACGHWNIPTLEEDALDMIQKKGISCAKCTSPLILELGQWVHAYPERAEDFTGLHIPQTIVRDRVTPEDRYLELYNKLHGIRKYSSAKFLNEVMGISVETGSSPITPAQIRAASILDIGPKKPFRPGDYSLLGGGVDWGGSEITSFTVATLVGLHTSGAFHCVNAIKPTGIPENERHLPVARFFIQNSADTDLFAIMADGEFVGRVQNPNLQAEAGVQVGSIHYGSLKSFYKPHPQNHFTVDRTTLLFVVFSLIKSGLLLFPRGEGFEAFTDDLRSVFIEETDTQRGTFQKYSRYVGLPDDFLHSLGYALFACAIGAGIDLPTIAGLSPQSSITRDYIDAIGTEVGVGIP